MDKTIIFDSTVKSRDLVQVTINVSPSATHFTGPGQVMTVPSTYNKIILYATKYAISS